MMPPIVRRYEANLVSAVDSLLSRIAIWEDGQFSASELELTRRETEEIAAWVINGVADPFGFGSQITGDQLLEVLAVIRGPDFSPISSNPYKS
jgi:hypothetical protein